MDENNVQLADGQDTILDAEAQQEESTTPESDTTPQVEEGQTDTSEQDEGEDTEEVAPFLEVQYNHEKRNLTRDEAITLAQKGIHFQSAYDTIERVAALKGQSVNEFLSGLESAQDEAYRRSLEEKFGEDEDTIDKMMELYNINKQKTLDNAKENQRAAAEQEEQTINERLANEFVEMKNGDFPELTEFKDLPEEVKRAAFEGLSLSHAYLKHMHNENKKIAAEKASQEAAAKKSTGSMAGDKEDVNTSTSALLKGLWG
jgi:hypothetical protein